MSLTESEDDDALAFFLHSKLKQNEKEHFFDVMSLTDIQFKTDFRFEKRDILRLQRALKIPFEIILSNGSKLTGLNVLCIGLKRLAYPNRLSDLSIYFNSSKTTLSLSFKWFIYHLHQSFKDKITFDVKRMDRNNLDLYSEKIKAKGSPLDNCIGFIDGTLRPCSRPETNQKIVYNGHKRSHGLKFQAFNTPDGLISHLAGPFIGTRHDSRMLMESGLLNFLNNSLSFNEKTFCLYGDPAYPVSSHLLAPYRSASLTELQSLFNSRMSRVRITVEWTFGKIVSLFAFLDYKKNLKLELQPIGLYYIVGALLTNCHSCLYGNQTSSFFDLSPPELEEYLSE